MIIRILCFHRTGCPYIFKESVCPITPFPSSKHAERTAKSAGRSASNASRYPLVVAATADEFYAIRGDMIDYIYGLQQRDHPTKRLYTTSFEFGTLGDTLYGLFQSPRVMIHENRAFWHGAVNDQVHAEAKRGFEELFNPSAPDWKEKAVRDAEQAFVGILKAEGYI